MTNDVYPPLAVAERILDLLASTDLETTERVQAVEIARTMAASELLERRTLHGLEVVSPS